MLCTGAAASNRKLCESSAPVLAHREMVRVTKDGGWIVVIDTD